MAKIFIVDDSRTSRKMLRTILEEHGHEICGEAENGQVAVDTYASCAPDIITLDITMPVMDGIEALRLIREKNSDVKILMVTAAGQKNKVVEAVKNGATEFVTKPFDAEYIIETINKCLA